MTFADEEAFDRARTNADFQRERADTYCEDLWDLINRLYDDARAAEDIAAGALASLRAYGDAPRTCGPIISWPCGLTAQQPNVNQCSECGLEEPPK